MTTSHGFELLREQYITELNTNARLFRHIETKAQLLSLENEDDNKVFGITFRTPPTDSTGLPHIMEHAVLCGSRKYPAREPFVELIKGSLKTFLNAFTFPDKTCYPVASQNLQDFYNLIDVYLDAVFYPRITPFILQQEGWHYELDNPADPLAFKGVVFNEMKGAYSSPDDSLSRHIQQSLYPDTIYGVDSGGDPAHIPDLTYEQFKSFHDTFYHPSNARVFFYGNDDPDERLRLMQGYLKDFKVRDINSDISLQPHFEQPKRLAFPYDAGQDEADGQKAWLTLNWLLPETSDPQLILACTILSHILIGTPASPLRKALIDSGLGEDLAGVGLEGELRQMFFSTGLKGIDPNNIDKVEALILQSLSNIVQNRLDPEMIEAALNTIEFRLRENNTGQFPQGLLLMLRCLVTWLYDDDPLAPLAFEEPLAAIKGRLQTEASYFESLIDQYLLQNAHRTTVVLEPDPDLNRRQEAAERECLAQAKARMNEADLQAVIENTRQLKQIQETPDPPEVLATIPSLTLADLDKENKLIPLTILEENGHKILYHDLFTNGLIYLDVGLNLRLLPPEFLPFVQLFGQALLKLGTETEDFVKLSQRIGRVTGGITPSLFSSMTPDTREGTAWLFLRGKATAERGDELLAILRDMLLTVKLDNPERFKQIVLEAKAQEEARIVPAGHSVVDTRLRAHFNEADWAAEQMKGVSYLFFLRQLVPQIEQNWPAVLEKLETVRRILLNRQSMLGNVTLDEANWAQFQPKVADFLAALPGGPANPARWSLPSIPDFEGLTIPAQVNYIGKGGTLYDGGYTLHGSVAVITNYLRTTWLWERIRIQGGAYGSFCLFDQHSGVLNFLSYRDPNSTETLNIYDQTGRFLRQTDLSQDELTKSIIGAIGQMDAYQLPDAKGYTSMTRYLVGDTDAVRQRLRNEILSTTLADFKAFADALEQVRTNGHVVILGSSEAIEQGQTIQGGEGNIIKVL